VPGRASPESWNEHVERYRFAATYSQGRNVLDVACGFGFGSDLLGKSGAKAVVGVDVDTEAIGFAREHYRQAGLSFAMADGQALPFSDSCFDACVSMGTLSHVERPSAFIKELSRVLRPRGVLVLSSPNRLVTNPGKPVHARPLNPYHFTEFTHDELRNLLGDAFLVEAYYGQMFFPAGRLVNRSSVLGVLARHPALPFLALPRAGRYLRSLLGGPGGGDEIEDRTFRVLRFEGRLRAVAEPLHMILVCRRR